MRGPEALGVEVCWAASATISSMAADASSALHGSLCSGTCREASIIGPRYRRWMHVRNGTCSAPKWRIARDTHPAHCRIPVGSASNRVFVMRVRTGLEVLEYEIREEQAATIGRLARELRDALDALDAFNRRANSGKTAAERSDLQRARLVDAAAYALWNFVVQRECSGFRGTEQALEDYAVPAEVRAKMGAIRPR